MMSGSVPTGDCLSVLQAELTSILAGMELAIQAGFRKLVMALDCLSAIQDCNGHLYLANSNGVIVRDIGKIACEFTVIKFAFERRQANECAHLLA